MRDLVVLITAAGNVFMPGTIDCLKYNGERKIRVIGADMGNDPTILQMCDKAYQVPRGDDPLYIDSLLKICRKEKVDILLPIMSVELEALSKNRMEFDKIGTKVSVSATESLIVANNKRKLLDFMSQEGLPCADYYITDSIESLHKAVYALGYPYVPVCIKATGGSGSRGFRILSETTDRFEQFMKEKPSSAVLKLEEFTALLSDAASCPELIVMEYLPGEEYSVDILAEQGKILCSCCRKSLHMENSIMLEAEIVKAPKAEVLCEKVAQLLGLDGNIGFDVRERKDGTALIMECNPRITAGISFFRFSGVNLPYLCIKKMLGETLPEIKPEYGIRVRRRWMEMAE